MKAAIVGQGIILMPESAEESAQLGTLAKDGVAEGIVDTTYALMPFRRCVLCGGEYRADVHKREPRVLGLTWHPYMPTARA